MICKSCGAEVSDGLLFCPKCGKRIAGSDEASTQENIKKANNYQNIYEQANVQVNAQANKNLQTNYQTNAWEGNHQYNSYNNPSYEDPDYSSKGKRSHLAIIFIAIICIVLASFAGKLIYDNYKKANNPLYGKWNYSLDNDEHNKELYKDMYYEFKSDDKCYETYKNKSVNFHYKLSSDKKYVNFDKQAISIDVGSGTKAFISYRFRIDIIDKSTIHFTYVNSDNEVDPDNQDMDFTLKRAK